jgi:precorrin-2 dehydrogenase / sirohydrochlorin ferrochelatase
MDIAQDQNPLYPVFFKLDRLKMLIVGAGEVGMEKLHFIIKSSPNANIRIIATWAAPDVQELVDKYPHNIQLVLKEFENDDVQGSDIIIAATNFPVVNQMVYEAAKSFGKIVNVADTPDLCDFYMGSIVTRGALKVAISTNGKSPTFAKRFRQVLEDILPTETNDLLTNLKVFRDKLKGDFNHKVKELNKLTETLITHD